MSRVDYIRFCTLEVQALPSGEPRPAVLTYTVDDEGLSMYPDGEMDASSLGFDLDEHTELSGYYCTACDSWFNSWYAATSHLDLCFRS